MKYILSYFPKWLSEKSIVAFLIAFALCTAVFGYPMKLALAVLSALSVLLFFITGRKLYLSWRTAKNKDFEKRLYWTGFLVRFIWVLYAYFYFNTKYFGYSFGDPADTTWYMPFAKDIAQWISEGFKEPFSDVMTRNMSAIDDVGYPFWLSILYLVFGTNNDVFIPFVVKCLVSSACSVFIYRIARSHFDENVARVSGLFVMLNPNLIFWCASMFKESEMVFLTCWYMYEMDNVISSNRKLVAGELIKALAIGASLLFFRSALGLVAFLAVLVHIVFASKKILSKEKKILAFVFVGLFLLIGFGDGIRERINNVQYFIETDQQKTNMEWRAVRKDGNSFSKYASSAVFAPLIFTIPFPTFNKVLEYQTMQMVLSGGNFIKNVLSFFVIFALIYLLSSGEWRKHVFIIAFTCGYLAALTLSNFAQSGRFHVPVLPVLMMWAAYGISLVQQRKVWVKRFNLVLAAEVVACMAWSWFKLKGRGMI